MIKFYKHIIDDSNWHYGCYLAYLHLLISISSNTNYISKEQAIIRPTYKPIEIKYDCNNYPTISIQYKSHDIKYLPLITTKENYMFSTTEEDEKIFDYFKNKFIKKSECNYDCLSEHSKNNKLYWSSEDIGAMKAQWLVDRLDWLASQLPKNVKVVDVLNDHPVGWRPIDSPYIIHKATRQIKKLENYLGINKKHYKIASAPSYNPEIKKEKKSSICDVPSTMYSHKNTHIKRKKNKDYTVANNVNININIGQINCKIF
jgi:hypothetical protein